MQGIWKEKLGGYDRKGNRRKRHSRKHTLKDKVKPFIKKFKYKDIENDVFHNEANNVEFIKPEPRLVNSVWIETWRVRVERTLSWKKPAWDSVYLTRNWSENIRTAYKTNGRWYDEYDHTEISGDVIPLAFLFKEQIELDEPIEIKTPRWWGGIGTKDELFVYGKPLPEDWHNIYGFWGRKSRKWYQTKANRKDRRLAKEFCRPRDWDGETVKTHCTSKSIAWDVW